MKKLHNVVEISTDNDFTLHQEDLKRQLCVCRNYQQEVMNRILSSKIYSMKYFSLKRKFIFAG